MRKNTGYLAGIVAAALMFGAATVYAQTEADFSVVLNSAGNGAVITRYTGTVPAVKIPATIQGLPVTEIGENVFIDKSDLITSVEIPGSVTVIGDSAFRGCTKLASVSLPASLETMGTWAFMQTGLTEVTIPGGIKTWNTDWHSKKIMKRFVAARILRALPF